MSTINACIFRNPTENTLKLQRYNIGDVVGKNVTCTCCCCPGAGMYVPFSEGPFISQTSSSTSLWSNYKRRTIPDDEINRAESRWLRFRQTHDSWHGRPKPPANAPQAFHRSVVSPSFDTNRLFSAMTSKFPLPPISSTLRIEPTTRRKIFSMCCLRMSFRVFLSPQCSLEISIREHPGRNPD